MRGGLFPRWTKDGVRRWCSSGGSPPPPPPAPSSAAVVGVGAGATFEKMGEREYDLVVLGSGPAGLKASIAAAKLGKKVAMVDKDEWLGGISVNTGTIPSKTLREAILYSSGFRQRLFYGRDYRPHAGAASDFRRLTSRVHTVISKQKEVIHAQALRNNVQLVDGHATFVDEHTVAVRSASGDRRKLHARNFLVCVGTRPAHAPHIPFDGHRVFDSDQLLALEETPHQLIVVGAGVIGIEYASMLGTLSEATVTVIDSRSDVLPFCDKEIIDDLMFHMRETRTKFRLGETVAKVQIDENYDRRVVVELESGKRIIGDSLLYAVGRQANTDSLCLENVGLTADSRGKLSVNAQYQTAVPHIYAAGDVIGFPSLASTSMLQGRVAVSHMYNRPCNPVSVEHMPYGIYSIPEISMVGPTEQELTKNKIPYEYGMARYSELAKGMMAGDEVGGMLKLLFHSQTRKLLAVHVIGESATEIVHIGQAALVHGAGLDFFCDNIFNYPTFAEAYQVAALDCRNKMSYRAHAPK
jgi:NAD(P) transhydrogenase